MPNFRGAVGRLAFNLWKDRLFYITDDPFHLHSVLLILAMEGSSHTPPQLSLLNSHFFCFFGKRLWKVFFQLDPVHHRPCQCPCPRHIRNIVPPSPQRNPPRTQVFTPLQT